MSDTNLNSGVQKNEFVTLAHNRLDDVCVTAFNYPALIMGNKKVHRGIWGKSELTVREAGKLAVAKHTLHLSPAVAMQTIDLAAFWPGYDAVACSPSANNFLLIDLQPQAGSVPRCGRCGQPSPLIHDRRIRRVRDRDLFDQRVLLQVPVRRVDCLSCGRVTERIDWLEPTSRLTRRMQAWILGLLQLLPISHVSRLT